jgi:TRAP-type C4-dicarboxylate transport system permease small subunit
VDHKKFVIIKKIGAGIQKTISGILILLMLVMVILMFLQIILRFCFGSPLAWAEEALRFMYIWLAFLGLPLGVYYNDLTRFDLLETMISGIAKKILETGIYIISNIMLYIIAWGALILISRQFTQQATTLPIPMSVVYLVIPVSSIIAFILVLIKILFSWTGTDFITEDSKK